MAKKFHFHFHFISNFFWFPAFVWLSDIFLEKNKKNNEKTGFPWKSGPNLMSFAFNRGGRGWTDKKYVWTNLSPGGVYEWRRFGGMIATLLRWVLISRGWGWRKPVPWQSQESPHCHCPMGPKPCSSGLYSLGRLSATWLGWPAWFPRLWYLILFTTFTGPFTSFLTRFGVSLRGPHGGGSGKLSALGQRRRRNPSCRVGVRWCVRAWHDCL